MAIEFVFEGGLMAFNGRNDQDKHDCSIIVLTITVLWRVSLVLRTTILHGFKRLVFFASTKNSLPG